MTTLTETAKSATVPEPKGQPLVGHLPALRRDALGFFVNARRDLGDIFRFRAGPRHPYLIAHPDMIKHVLLDNYQNYQKDSAYEKTGPLLGKGLLTSEGDFWLRQRRLAQPMFHRGRIGGFADTMVASTASMLDERWSVYERENAPFDVAAEMMRLTLTIVGWTLFSTDVSGEAERVGRALSVALEHTNARMRSLLNLESLPTPANRRFREAIATLDEVVYGLIDERRKAGDADDKQDLLSMLLAARDADTGEGMTDKQVRDEAMTLFLAGHETTANALAWTFYLLSSHPTAAEGLFAEADALGHTPTVADLPKLPYTKMVVEEAMRLYPPAWAVGRRALSPDEIGGYPVEAGSDVVISTYVTHRHSDFWPNPEGFNPERFTKARAEGRHRFAYLPFGGGPRGCIGNNFAMMEAQLILETVAQRYALELVPGHPVEPQTMITLRPKNGILMRLRPRT